MARSSRFYDDDTEEIIYRPKFHSFETSDISLSFEESTNGDNSIPLILTNGNIQRTSSMYNSHHHPKVDLSFLIACRNNDERLLEVVLEGYPNVETLNQQDRSGRTGLNHICMHGNMSMLEMLGDLSRLDVNLGDSEGNTPLITAAQAGHVEVVGFLLDKFKDAILIDHRNVFGMTALMKAALQGRTKCSKLLLAAGANAYLCDPRRHYCPLQWARYCSRYSCADLIEKFMKGSSKPLPLQNKALSAVSSNKWSSEPELTSRESPPSPGSRSSKGSENSWFKQKLKKTFRYEYKTRRNSNEYGILSNMTSSAVMCASSAILQNTDVDRELISEENLKKSIVIPKLEVLQHIGGK